ncbi:MAG: extracellular solute-binding protein [Chloroflexota bacterium]
MTAGATAGATAGSTVGVLYAGSLVNLMETGIGPAFEKESGAGYHGQGAGSIALANAIKDKTKFADVFISADPVVNSSLMGASNGNWLSAYLLFARTTLVIGYSPKSRFAADFEKAAKGDLPWYQVLEKPGLRLGRTDPALDPKGYHTLFLFDLADQLYHRTGLKRKILGADENPAQVFPEETLESRLESGALDAGFFYLNEAVEKHLPYITLPSAINQGDPAQAAHYATVSYTSPAGKTFKGSPIVYTVAALNHARHAAAARAFERFLFSPTAQAIMKRHGLLSTPVLYGGSKAALPAALQSLAKGRYAG